MRTSFFMLVLLFAAINANAQFTLSGNVLLPDGKAAADVNIQLEGTSFHSTSDLNGEFKFSNLAKGKYLLKCKHLGFANYTKEIELSESMTISISLIKADQLTEEVVVSSTRTSPTDGTVYSTMNKEEIAAVNIGQDVPYLMQSLPSVVVSSDAGNGVGYTGMRIRGSDPGRINVTINGIPLNDAESQQVYWVDLPDFASSTDNIQVQRGVGTSTNGSGAFGGSVNLLSNKITAEPYANSSNAYGSFNTIKNNISFGTGLLKDHFAFEGRLSQIESDGYIDRGASNLQSFYIGAGYYDKNSIVRFNMFSGHEKTYQCWNGVPESRINNDAEGMQEYISNNGLDEAAANNLLTSGRNYNYYTYDNQVDDYGQTHYQLLLSHQINSLWLANIAFHYTRGKGYYEEYEANQDLNDYGIEVDSGESTTSDLIRRKWLDNDFYGTTFSLQYNDDSKNNIIFGGAINQYVGDHFGEVIWAQNAGNSSIRHVYYDDKATKNDITFYGKWTYTFNTHFNTYLDLQYRGVTYDFEGAGSDGAPAPQSVSLNFFNPKAGANWNFNPKSAVYASIAVGNREPIRDDYVESAYHQYPKPESMVDFELGYRYQNQRFNFTANNYIMYYHDQLVLTGEVNDVGNYTRTNTPISYRTGIELEAGYKFNRYFRFDMNITFSQNKIKDFSEFLDTYDADYNYTGQTETVYHNTTIAFAPSRIACGSLTFSATKNLNIQLIAKNVSEQYLDNTQNSSRIIDAYTVTDIRINYSIPNKITKQLQFNVLLNNIFDKMYSSNGYSYGYIVADTSIHENMYYPQAGFNFLGQLTLGF